MTSSNSQKQESINVMMCGLPGAGKSTIVQVIKHGKFIGTTSTIGVDFEKLIIGTTPMRAWEFGGRERFRPMTRMYHRIAKAFAYVVDSNDRAGIDRARNELHEIRNDEVLKGRPILIVANKQDLPDAMSLDEIKDKLALDKFDDNAIWHLQAASAVRNEGIKEGFEWLANCFVEKTGIMKPIIETLNDTAAMKNDLLSIFNWNSWKKVLNKFVDF